VSPFRSKSQSIANSSADEYVLGPRIGIDETLSTITRKAKQAEEELYTASKDPKQSMTPHIEGNHHPVVVGWA